MFRIPYWELQRALRGLRAGGPLYGIHRSGVTGFERELPEGEKFLYYSNAGGLHADGIRAGTGMEREVAAIGKLPSEVDRGESVDPRCGCVFDSVGRVFGLH